MEGLNEIIYSSLSRKNNINNLFSTDLADISKIVIRHVPPDAKGWQVLVPDNIDVENKAYSTNSKIVIENFELTSKLLVDCEIGVILEMHNWSGSYEQMEPTLDSTFAADVLRELYDSQKGSDVVLVVGQRQFNAHKAILMARSEYFNAMFENQMTESQTNRVDIKDFDENVIEVLLKFLYTGRVTQLTDDVCPQLLSAADKYQLNDLKSICGQYLYSHLNNDNAIQALLLADALNDDKLKNRSLIYIKNSMKQLVDRSDWNLLIETNIPLVKEILLFSTQNK